MNDDANQQAQIETGGDERPTFLTGFTNCSLIRLMGDDVCAYQAIPVLRLVKTGGSSKTVVESQPGDTR